MKLSNILIYSVIWIVLIGETILMHSPKKWMTHSNAVLDEEEFAELYDDFYRLCGSITGRDNMIFIVWIVMHVFIISCWTRFQRKYNIDNCVLIVIFE